jgi:histidine triad (HIT) family protein
MSEENCLFCKIIQGKIPGDFVYQDDGCVVIRDINPQAPMHMLVIPREHIESLADVAQKEEGLLGHLLRVGARVANDQDHESYRTLINTGAEAGQSVFHLHVHILGGRAMNWPPG